MIQSHLVDVLIFWSDEKPPNNYTPYGKDWVISRCRNSTFLVESWMWFYHWYSLGFELLHMRAPRKWKLLGIPKPRTIVVYTDTTFFSKNTCICIFIYIYIMYWFILQSWCWCTFIRCLLNCGQNSPQQLSPFGSTEFSQVLWRDFDLPMPSRRS